MLISSGPRGAPRPRSRGSSTWASTASTSTTSGATRRSGSTCSRATCSRPWLPDERTSCANPAGALLQRGRARQRPLAHARRPRRLARCAPSCRARAGSGSRTPSSTSATTRRSSAAGFGVLVFDYRGFGDSEGDRGVLSPAGQLRDLVNAVTLPDHARRRRRRRDRRLRHRRHRRRQRGPAGRGRPARPRRGQPGAGRRRRATGCTACARSTSGCRFLESLDEDRRQRVLTGRGRLVHPREEIMVPTPERRATNDQGRRRRPHPDQGLARRRPRRSSRTGPSTRPPRSRRR